MSTFHLTVSSPDGNLFDGDASALMLRGALGDLAILAGHADFITTVVPGKCRILSPDGEERAASLGGGILSVSSGNATLLAGSFRFEDQEN